MDFSLTPEQELLKNTIRQFAEKEITPLIEEAEAKHEFPKQILPKMGKLGYLGISFPAEYGGSADENVSTRKVNECIWFEEMSRVSAGISFGIQAAVVGAPNYILRDYSDEAQKQKYLPAAIRGEKIGAFSLTEPNAGSDAASIKTTAVKDGDFYVMNGNKIFAPMEILPIISPLQLTRTKRRAPRQGSALLSLRRGPLALPLDRSS